CFCFRRLPLSLPAISNFSRQRPVWSSTRLAIARKKSRERRCSCSHQGLGDASLHTCLRHLRRRTAISGKMYLSYCPQWDAATGRVRPPLQPLAQRRTDIREVCSTAKKQPIRARRPLQSISSLLPMPRRTDRVLRHSMVGNPGLAQAGLDVLLVELLIGRSIERNVDLQLGDRQSRPQLEQRGTGVSSLFHFVPLRIERNQKELTPPVGAESGSRFTRRGGIVVCAPQQPGLAEQ